MNSAYCFRLLWIIPCVSRSPARNRRRRTRACNLYGNDPLPSGIRVAAIPLVRVSLETVLSLLSALPGAPRLASSTARRPRLAQARLLELSTRPRSTPTRRSSACAREVDRRPLVVDRARLAVDPPETQASSSCGVVIDPRFARGSFQVTSHTRLSAARGFARARSLQSARFSTCNDLGSAPHAAVGPRPTRDPVGSSPLNGTPRSCGSGTSRSSQQAERNPAITDAVRIDRWSSQRRCTYASWAPSQRLDRRRAHRLRWVGTPAAQEASSPCEPVLEDRAEHRGCRSSRRSAEGTAVATPLFR